MCMNGFKYWFEQANLLTLWSAPNFAYRCANEAAILSLDTNLERRLDVFNSVSDYNKDKYYNTKVLAYFY